MRVLCRNLPPILRVCIAPVEDAYADNGTVDAPPDSPNKASRRWPQLVSPKKHMTEERTPLAGAGAEAEREDLRPSDEEDEDEDDDDDDDDDDQGQTRYRGRDREARAEHDEAVQQVACVLPFEEEAEVRAVREEEASFLAALGITEGGEEGEEGEEEGEEEESEEALEAEEAAIFAQLLNGSSDAPPPRSANGLQKARLQRARSCAPCAAAMDVPEGMPPPSCPLLLSAAQRQRRLPSPVKVVVEDAEETDQDSDEENTAAVAVEAAAVAGVGGGRARTRTVSQRWARTGTGSV